MGACNSEEPALFPNVKIVENSFTEGSLQNKIEEITVTLSNPFDKVLEISFDFQESTALAGIDFMSS